MAYITPELTDEINKNIIEFFLPKFEAFKEYIYNYITENNITDIAKDVAVVAIGFIAFTKFIKHISDINDRYQLFR